MESGYITVGAYTIAGVHDMTGDKVNIFELGENNVYSILVICTGNICRSPLQKEY